MATFTCPSCRSELTAPEGADHISAACPTCKSDFEAYFFPALTRERAVGAAAASLVDHTEASCYYHPQKQAVQVCDGCGRLICALCSIDMGHEHLCPGCLSSGKRKGKITSLENTRTCYDRIAMTLAVLGILLWFLSIFTAPAAIYLAIRHWNSPASLLGTGRTRFIIAIILASLELLAWVVVVSVYATMGGTHK